MRRAIGSRLVDAKRCASERAANERVHMATTIEELEARRAAAQAGRRREAHRGAACQGAADRARAIVACCSTPDSFEEVDMYVEHNCVDFGMENAEIPGRRRGHRVGHDQRPAGLCLRAGFHRVRRVAVGAPRAEDLQGDGRGDEGRRAGDRAQRLGRRAHPGGGRQPWRLCRGVPAQRAGVGRGAAAVADHGAVRGRRGLFAGDDRLHLHGEGFQLHVRHRAGRGQDGDQRGGDAGRAWRGGDAHDQVGRGRCRVRE